MTTPRLARYTAIGILLFLGVTWTLASALQATSEADYPNANLLVSADWLQQHIQDTNLIVVDVRTDEYFHDDLITGAIRLPWRSFRYNNVTRQIGSLFVGAEQAQEILGKAGILPTDTLVLYDSVERDGGATASYVFWVLDVLGHENKKLLNGGIDAWKAVGGAVATEPASLEPVLYQADQEDIRSRPWGSVDFVFKRLGDPYYQIIDVRSRDEYLGETGNTDMNDQPLKLGHVPGAMNIEYVQAWAHEETKLIKPYAELQETYRGIDADLATVVYCHSGRRGSFSYFVLRLMGFRDPILFEGSWNEWGDHRNYMPTELQENNPTSSELPGKATESGRADPASRSTASEKTSSGSPDRTDTGYVSCGG